MTFNELKAAVAIAITRQAVAATADAVFLLGECPHCHALDILGGAYIAGIVEHSRAEGESFEDFAARMIAEFTSHLTEVINEARND